MSVFSSHIDTEREITPVSLTGKNFNFLITESPIGII